MGELMNVCLYSWRDGKMEGKEVEEVRHHGFGALG